MRFNINNPAFLQMGCASGSLSYGTKVVFDKVRKFVLSEDEPAAFPVILSFGDSSVENYEIKIEYIKDGVSQTESYSSLPEDTLYLYPDDGTTVTITSDIQLTIVYCTGTSNESGVITYASDVAEVRLTGTALQSFQSIFGAKKIIINAKKMEETTIDDVTSTFVSGYIVGAKELILKAKSQLYNLWLISIGDDFIVNKFDPSILALNISESTTTALQTILDNTGSKTQILQIDNTPINGVDLSQLTSVMELSLTSCTITALPALPDAIEILSVKDDTIPTILLSQYKKLKSVTLGCSAESVDLSQTSVSSLLIDGNPSVEALRVLNIRTNVEVTDITSTLTAVQTNNIEHLTIGKTSNSVATRLADVISKSSVTDGLVILSSDNDSENNQTISSAATTKGWTVEYV